MAAMLRDSVVVVVVVVRTRPRAIPLATITTKKSLHGFPLIYHDAYGAPCLSPSGRGAPLLAKNVSFVSTKSLLLSVKKIFAT